jgi:type III secretory pathway component EscS
MSTETLTLILSVIQTVAIVASVVGLMWQLKQLKWTILSTDDYKILDFYVKINEVLFNRLTILKYFPAKGINQLNNDEEKESYLYLSLIMSYFEYIFYLHREKRIEDKTWEPWEKWVVETFMPSDLFKTFWEHEQAYLTEEFRDYVNEKHSEVRAP